MDKKIFPISKSLLKAKKHDKKVMSSRYIERLNYVRLSYYLINCGYFTQWFTVDDRGADFIAIKHDSSVAYRIQLKSRMELNKKYKGKGLYIAFPLASVVPEKDWVIVNFDDLENIFGHEKSYLERGSLSHGSVPKKYRNQVIEASLISPVSFDWFDGQ